MNETESNQLKYDYALEIQLLGAMFVDPSLISIHGHELTADDFIGGRDGFGGFWDFVVGMHGCGRRVDDIGLLMSELSRSDVNAEFKSKAFVGKVFSSPGLTWNVPYYISRIKANADLRKLSLMTGELSMKLQSPVADPAEIRQWLDAKIAASSVNSGNGDMQTIGEIAKEIVASLKEPKALAGRAVLTGLIRHDSDIGGWMPGELIVLAARPGMGKTAMATQIAKWNAYRKHQVLFVSIEMTKRELGGRVLATESHVNGRKLRTGSVDAAEMNRLEISAEDLRADTLTIWAPAQRDASIGSIRARAKHKAAQGGLSLLVVDYIGMVKTDNKKIPRHEQVAEVSGALKGLAKELNVPVLALCQLNREDVGSEPRLNNLRDSGAIEQDADIVMFLHREKPDSKECSWIIAKHRHSSVGTMRLIWHKERTLFTDPSTGSEWDY